MLTYTVVVPANVGPGQKFKATFDGRLTSVTVPSFSGPNSTLHVQIPVHEGDLYEVTVPAGVGPDSYFDARLGGQTFRIVAPVGCGPNAKLEVVTRRHKSWADAGGPTMPCEKVAIPAGVGPGQQFQASLAGFATTVRVPPGSKPQSTLHVRILSPPRATEAGESMGATRPCAPNVAFAADPSSETLSGAQAMTTYPLSNLQSARLLVDEVHQLQSRCDALRTEVLMLRKLLCYETRAHDEKKGRLQLPHSATKRNAVLSRKISSLEKTMSDIERPLSDATAWLAAVRRVLLAKGVRMEEPQRKIATERAFAARPATSRPLAHVLRVLEGPAATKPASTEPPVEHDTEIAAPTASPTSQPTASPDLSFLSAVKHAAAARRAQRYQRLL